MNSLNTVNSRDNNRRAEERRNHCRRVIKYSFGSDQWIQAIRASYVLWPKEDRRYRERRSVSRRRIERRIQIQKYRRRLSHRLALETQIERQALTDEEKDMLSSLSRH